MEWLWVIGVLAVVGFVHHLYKEHKQRQTDAARNAEIRELQALAPDLSREEIEDLYY